MAIEKVKEYLRGFGRESDVLEFGQSCATVQLAAQAVGVLEQRIAKTLSFQDGEGAMLIVCAGDTRLDNKKFKAEFGFKARMLSPEDALRFTGHAVGGVCPFALPEGVKVFLDDSLRRFDTVFPSCGASNSAIELDCDELFEYSQAEKWVDVCTVINET